MDHPKPASPLVSHANCEHLRHKGMYVMSVVDPAEFQFYDKYDATAYWCTKMIRLLTQYANPGFSVSSTCPTATSF